MNDVAATAGVGPLQAWRARVREGGLDHDPVQELAAEKLQSLHRALNGYEPLVERSWLDRLGLGRRNEEPPCGLYIYGGVGRGKSMLMDLFFDTAPVKRKRRVHFHEFMLEIHDRLHALRSGAARVDDVLPEVAAQIAEDAWLLCFDEFHVTNIADAMILGRLFEALFARGVIVIATSNWPPDDLYKGGLQRELFLPFIALIQQKLDVLHLEAERDYRLARLMTMQVYHLPLGPVADTALAQAFQDLTDGAPANPSSLTVKGRTVPVAKAARGVAWFTFADLCQQPLGAADYIAIAVAYRTVIVANIPRLKPEQRNEAKRFATLIDALYERRVKLICSAAVSPPDLYAEGAHSFEFERTVSRLMEMQSVEYISEQAEAA